MRIAHVTDCFWPRFGGIETQVLALAVRQARAGHRVSIFTSTAGPAGPVDGVLIERLAAPSSPFPVLSNPWSLRRAAHTVTASGVDVVHAHVSTASTLAPATAWAASRAGIPTALTLHSVLAWERPVHRLIARASDWPSCPVAWTAVSAAAAGPLSALGDGRLQVDVLPNGIDADVWQRPGAAADSSRVRIVAVGRLAARKRLLPLLRVLRRVRAAVPAGVRLEAVLAGEGPQRGVLERYLARHDMAGWVSLPGLLPRPDIADLLASADVFVAPAVLESFGIAALEARCAGVPVVAYAASGIADFVTDGREGLLARDDDDLVLALVRLATQPELRLKLARHNAGSRPAMDWSCVLPLTDEVYRRAVALQSAPELPSTQPQRWAAGREPQP